MQQAYRINWRNSIAEISSFFQPNCRGIICISGGDSSGWVNFGKFLYDHIIEANPSALFVSVDPLHGTVRYKEQIISHVEGILKLDGEQQKTQININQTIYAMRDGNTGDIDISGERFTISLPMRVARIKNELSSLNRRLVILASNCQELPSETHDWLVHHLLHQNRDRAETHIVLLARICNTNTRSCKHRFYFDRPGHWVILPEEYHGDDLEYAIIDLMELLRSWGYQEEGLRVRAETILQAYNFQPAKVQEELFRFEVVRPE